MGDYQVQDARTDSLIFSLNFFICALCPSMCYRGLLLSLAVSMVFILLLRFTARLLLWTTIITVILLLAYGVCSQGFTLF